VIFKNCGIGDKSTMFHSYFMVYERFSQKGTANSCWVALALTVGARLGRASLAKALLHLARQHYSSIGYAFGS